MRKIVRMEEDKDQDEEGISMIIIVLVCASIFKFKFAVIGERVKSSVERALSISILLIDTDSDLTLPLKPVFPPNTAMPHELCSGASQGNSKLVLD